LRHGHPGFGSRPPHLGPGQSDLIRRRGWLNCKRSDDCIFTRLAALRLPIRRQGNTPPRHAKQAITYLSLYHHHFPIETHAVAPRLSSPCHIVCIRAPKDRPSAHARTRVAYTRTHTFERDTCLLAESEPALSAQGGLARRTGGDRDVPSQKSTEPHVILSCSSERGHRTPFFPHREWRRARRPVIPRSPPPTHRHSDPDRQGL